MSRRKRKPGKVAKKKSPGLRDRLAAAADVPVTALTGGFRTEIFANRELLIENYKEILEYGETLIRIDCGGLVMRIEGESLTLVAMNGKELSLRGNFFSISYMY